MSYIKGFLCIQITNTKGHCMKLFKSHCRLNIHKYFYVNRIVNNWNNLHESVVKCNTVSQYISRIHIQETGI